MPVWNYRGLELPRRFRRRGDPRPQVQSRSSPDSHHRFRLTCPIRPHCFGARRRLRSSSCTLSLLPRPSANPHQASRFPVRSTCQRLTHRDPSRPRSRSASSALWTCDSRRGPINRVAFQRWKSRKIEKAISRCRSKEERLLVASHDRKWTKLPTSRSHFTLASPCFNLPLTITGEACPDYGF